MNKYYAACDNCVAPTVSAFCPEEHGEKVEKLLEFSLLEITYVIETLVEKIFILQFFRIKNKKVILFQGCDSFAMRRNGTRYDEKTGCSSIICPIEGKIAVS